jgi:hypothetical protein
MRTPAIIAILSVLLAAHIMLSEVDLGCSLLCLSRWISLCLLGLVNYPLLKYLWHTPISYIALTGVIGFLWGWVIQILWQSGKRRWVIGLLLLNSGTMFLWFAHLFWIGAFAD